MPDVFFTNIDSESITQMSSALALEGSPAFGTDVIPYLPPATLQDAPEGAYMCWMRVAGTGTVAGHLPLAATLPAGTYYIFLYGQNYDNHSEATITMGGATSDTIALDDRDDPTLLWSTRMTIVTTSTASSLILTLERDPTYFPVDDHKLLWRGIYITTNANHTITGSGIAVDLNYPTAMDDSAAVKGNLIPNGGFETGVDALWGFEGEGGGQVVPVNTKWDNTQGHSGAGCLKMTHHIAERLQPGNTAVNIVSSVYHLKANKQYAFSGWFKKTTGGFTTVQLFLINTFKVPAGITPPRHEIHSAAATLTSTWQRISVSGYLLEYPTCDYQISINCGIPDDAEVLIDDLQLEEGSETAFAPAASLEAAIRINMTTQPSNIFWTTDTIEGTLTARNNTGSTASGSFKYEIYDFMNRVVASGTVALSVAANTTHTEAFDLDYGKLGAFRIVSWIDGSDRTEREITYSIIPPPSTMGVDLTSNVGIHPNYTDFQFTTLRRMGIKWVRDLSPASYGRWNIAEPADNSFVFFDTEVALARSYGMTPMCTLGTNDYWPAWAASGGLPIPAKYGEYCRDMAAHYNGTAGPLIQHWEYWNEPRVFTAAKNAELMKQMVDGIKAAFGGSLSGRTIIGMGGLTPAEMQAIIVQIESLYPSWVWQSDMTVLATHCYVGGIPPEDLTSSIIDGEGVDVWNTETGCWDFGFKAGNTSCFVAWGKPVYPHADADRFYRGQLSQATSLVENYARSIAARMKRYFYYDSRYYSGPNFFEHHPTIWEYDGAVKAKGIAYAIAGSLIGHATGMENVAVDINSTYLMFDTGGTNPVAFITSADRTPRTLTLSLSGSQFEVLDLMRNPITITGTTVLYGRVPIYIRGLGISAATLSAALSGGVVASVADTVAPHISISDGPRGPVMDGRFRMRWIAIDETSYPNLGEINMETLVLTDVPDPKAILYSYQLSPLTTWSTWAAGIYVDYSGIAAGSYTFSVRAQDKAGNISATSRSVQVGDVVATSPVPPSAMLVMF